MGIGLPWRPMDLLPRNPWDFSVVGVQGRILYRSDLTLSSLMC